MYSILYSISVYIVLEHCVAQTMATPQQSINRQWDVKDARCLSNVTLIVVYQGAQGGGGEWGGGINCGAVTSFGIDKRHVFASDKTITSIVAFALFIRHVASFTSFVSIFYRVCAAVCVCTTVCVCVCFLQHLFRAERQLLVFCLPSFCFVARYHCCCSCSFFATPSTDMCSCLRFPLSLPLSPFSLCVCACYLLDSCVQFMQDLGTHTLLQQRQHQQHLVPHNFCICYKFQMDFSALPLLLHLCLSLPISLSLIFYVFAHGIRYVYVSLRFGRGLFGFGFGRGCIHMH